MSKTKNQNTPPEKKVLKMLPRFCPSCEWGEMYESGGVLKCSLCGHTESGKNGRAE